MFSTLGDYMSTVGQYHEYTRGCSVHQGDIMSMAGATMSTPGGVQYTGDIMSTVGVSVHWGYHEYSGGCSVYRRDTMSTPGLDSII